MTMTKWNKKNTIFIMAPIGYARRCIEEKGIKVFSPYYGDDLPMRLLREICFRIPFLPKVVWYNKEILNNKYECINIIDVNITSHYLKWIKKIYPNAHINFLYDNMVGKARNIPPNKIPNSIDIWTYDDYDSRKYGIKLRKNYWLDEKIFGTRKKSEIDVFFVGCDKGRAERLLELEKKLQSMGVTTKFIITKDKRYSKKKSFYQDAISYSQVIDYDSRSRAILNITMENQEGVTMRDMESIAIGVKLITTNKNIVNKDLYNKNNVFILDVDDIEEIPNFLNSEYIDVLGDIKDAHTFEAMLDEITTRT